MTKCTGILLPFAGMCWRLATSQQHMLWPSGLSMARTSELLPMGGPWLQPTTCQRCTLADCHLLNVCTCGLAPGAGVHWWPAVCCWHAVSACCLWLQVLVACRLLLACASLLLFFASLCIQPVATHQHRPAACDLSPAQAGGLPHVASMCWPPPTCHGECWHPFGCRQHVLATCPLWPACRWPAECRQGMLGASCLFPGCTNDLPPFGSTCWQPATCRQCAPAA